MKSTGKKSSRQKVTKLVKSMVGKKWLKFAWWLKFLPVFTLRVESFAGRNFRGDKLSRTPMVKIKFRGYKLSRTWQILVKFSYFDVIFSDFSCNISRTPMKVRFRGYKLSRTPKKLAKSQKFLPAKLSTFKVIQLSQEEKIYSPKKNPSVEQMNKWQNWNIFGQFTMDCIFFYTSGSY